MSDVFREVDEEVRREQLMKLWRAYGNYAIALAIVIIVAFGGFLGWRDWRERQALEQGTRFAGALIQAREGKNPESADAFASLAEGSGAGYRALARLQEAAARLRAKDVPAAVAVYDRLAVDDGVEAEWRDLGRLLAALHLINSAPPDELDRRLQPLLAKAGPWQYSARELAASVRLKAGDVPAAREAFRQLADDAAAPAGVRARAAELLAALGDRS